NEFPRNYHCEKIVLAEAYADHEFDWPQFNIRLAALSRRRPDGGLAWAVDDVCSRRTDHCLWAASRIIYLLRDREIVRRRPYSEVVRREQVVQSDLFRDIFGNPFRPVTFDPAWQTSTAVALANTMYTARDFAARPVLADALEEAGCNHPDV